MKKLSQAKPITNPALGSIKSESGVSFFGKLISSLVTLSLIIGSLVFFFLMITGAIAWITSGGDKTKLESARSKLTNALTGFVILLVTFAIVKLIENFFGIDILVLDIGALKIR